DNSDRTRGLARKLTCPEASEVAALAVGVVAGAVLCLIIEVTFTLTDVDDWGGDTREAMIELEQAFSETKSQISPGVFFASLIMALDLVVIACIMDDTAQSVAGGIVRPINQPPNRMDFSRQVGIDTLYRDIDELMEEIAKDIAKSITVVEFANTTVATGNTSEAPRIYVETLALCKKCNFADADMNSKLINAYVDMICGDTSQKTTVRSR
ncbi:unnamed protein product, partial [Ectocarpus fasciculatus]